MEKKKEKSEWYDISIPQWWYVYITRKSWDYEEEYQVKSTLSWIEAWIRTKFGDNVRVNKIIPIPSQTMIVDLSED